MSDSTLFYRKRNLGFQEEKVHEAFVQHVLVVDDDADLARSYQEVLMSQGYCVTVVSNGAEALREILKADVDAILCDLMMPHMSGDMFYKAVERARPHLCKRFIFITAYEGSDDITGFIKKVKSVVLYKPVTAGRLLGTLKLLFQKLESEPRTASGGS